MIVTFDFETKGIQDLPDYPPEPVGLALKIDDKPGRYIAWGHPTNNNGTMEEARALLASYWNDPTVDMLAHNDPFDLLVAHVHFRLPLFSGCTRHDTLVMSFLLDPHARTHALKPLGERLLGMPPEEQDAVREWLIVNGIVRKGKKDYGEFIWLAPGDLVGEYAVGDVERTYKLYQYFVEKVKDTGMWDAYRREMQLQPIMLENTRDGICVAVDRLIEDIATYDNAVERINQLLFQTLNCEPFNLDSDEQLAEAIDRAHPGLVWTKTPTGKRSTSKANMEKTLEGLTGKLLALMQYRASVLTCVNTFMRPWLIQAQSPKGNGRIRCQWHTTRSDDGGARTGRLSSSPNFMNIPTLASHKFAAVLELWAEWLKDDGFPPLPNVRSYVLPDIDVDEDQVLVSYDFASQELRVLAHYEDGLLLKAYKENPKQDLHQFAANTISEVLSIAFNRKHAKTCIAKGSLVLTDKGLLKIEDITGLHRVWDGIQYVQHTGVINKGFQRVMTYQGLTATPDHEVFTNEYGKLELQYAAKLGANIIKAGKATEPIWVLENYKSSWLAKAWGTWWKNSHILASTMREVWRNSLEAVRQCNVWLLNTMPILQYNQVSALLSTRSKVLGDTTAMQQPKSCSISLLWWERHSMSFPVLRRICAIYRDKFSNGQLQVNAHRQDRQCWKLRAWESTSSYITGKCREQINKCKSRVQRAASLTVAYVALAKARLPKYAARAGAYYKTPSSWSALARYNTSGAAGRWAEVYDITNAGPRNRFTVSDCLVSNCAFSILYGSGLDALAAGLSTTRDDAATIKGAYLQVLPGLEKLIGSLKTRARNNQPIRTWGGRLYYVEPPKFMDGRWRTFDYKLLNYLIQGSSADITKTAIIDYHSKKKHGRFLLTVHDQIVISVNKRYLAAESLILQECMESVPLDAQLLADGSWGCNLHEVVDFDAKELLAA